MKQIERPRKLSICGLPLPRSFNMAKPRVQFCPKGHDKDIVGRTKRDGCRLCDNNRSKIYYANNRERLNAKNKQWHYEHLSWGREYIKKIYATDVQKKLAILLRTRINTALGGKRRSVSVIKMLGCPVSELVIYLESKWLPGMTWNNHGRGSDKWHIDHIIPLDSFDLTDKEQFSKACHYTNLQPLWQQDNLRKSNKILVREI
jgi:hypothetical protein